MGRSGGAGALQLTATHLALAIALVATPGALARQGVTLDGSWSGTIRVPSRRALGTASSTLGQAGRSVTGTLALSSGRVAGTFAVGGALRGGRLLLDGALGSRRLRWRARWSRRRRAWRGPMLVRGGGATVRAVLTLTRDGGGPAPECGGDYFAAKVMPTVMDPICAQCHVPGGLAQAAAFRVTPGNATATARSALAQVDPVEPSRSRLLAKPRGDVPHGGGQRIVPGSVEEQVLTRWIEIVTAPGCIVGGGDGGTGAELYASNCASCHGTDATGTAGAPNVRCATRALDAVRVGRGSAMPSLPGLTDAQVALVQSHLNDLCTAAGRPGGDLYLGNCSTCHGPTARGGQNALGVRGPEVRCSRAIAAPVRSGMGADMPAFPALAAADVVAIQRYLATELCAIGTATGAELYAGNCASCHGADARGGGGNPNIRCHRAIRDAVLSGRSGPSGTMPAFAMTDGEVALVQGHLLALCPPGSAGNDLFAANCAGCHGPDAGGTSAAVNVRCATRVADALERGRGTRMPSFPGFVAADVASTQAFLAQLCTAHGRTGVDLYDGNCSTCHGATAGGGRNGLGVRGPAIACTGANDYQEKVQSGDDDMPAFPALDSGDVDAIVSYVHGTFCPD